jgi:hypothetical protein
MIFSGGAELDGRSKAVLSICESSQHTIVCMLLLLDSPPVLFDLPEWARFMAD